MHRDPGWPVCQRCGTRLRRYELALVERADGRRSVSALLDLDARARRDVVRVWHEQCFAAARDQPAAPADGALGRAPLARRERRRQAQAQARPG